MHVLWPLASVHVLWPLGSVHVLWPLTSVHVLWPLACVHVLWPLASVHVLWPLASVHVLWPLACVHVLWPLAWPVPLKEKPRPLTRKGSRPRPLTSLSILTTGALLPPPPTPTHRLVTVTAGAAGGRFLQYEETAPLVASQTAYVAIVCVRTCVHMRACMAMCMLVCELMHLCVRAVVCGGEGALVCACVGSAGVCVCHHGHFPLSPAFCSLLPLPGTG